MTAFNLREACSGDAESIREIYAPFVKETPISFETEVPTVDEMYRRIEQYRSNHAYFVAISNNKVVGYAYGSVHRTREAYKPSTEVTVYVAQNEQRKGIGRSLYAKLLPRLKQKGFHAAFAAITLPNPKSIALHEAAGFTHAGTFKEVGRKFNAWHDVGWWQRLL
jgi:L-amino acid N-acyltransferase YncA